MRPLAVVLLSVAIASGTSPATVCDAMCGTQAPQPGAVATHHSTRSSITPHHHGVEPATGLIRSTTLQCTRALKANDCRDLERAAALQDSGKLRLLQHVADTVGSTAAVNPCGSHSQQPDFRETGPPRASKPSFISLRI